MNTREIKTIFNQIETFGKNPPLDYEVEVVARGPLENFHQWADGKPSIGTIKVKLPGKEPYYLFFCTWIPEHPERHYLVVYPFSKLNPLMEIWNVEDSSYLNWKYRPNKRGNTPEDSKIKNEALKIAFQSIQGGLELKVKIPQSPDDVKGFLHNILRAVENRIAVESTENNISPSSNQNFWIEKTKVHGRPDRMFGDFSLGSALWSPQEDKGGKDIYKNMRLVKPDDVVIHFTDDKGVSGLSIVKLECDDSLIGLDNTEWSGRPGYLVKLKAYIELDPFFHRTKFLANSKYSKQLKEIRKNNKGLFYQDNLDLRQGGYLTAAPMELVILLNQAYKEFSGESLPYMDFKEIKTKKVKTAMEEKNKKNEFPLNLIYYGPPGTGKTYNAIKQAVKICDNTLPDNESDCSKRFKELLESKQISMVSFHQSYGYEEFVEGIRPVLNQDGASPDEPSGDGIHYECRDGIFKNLCMLAKSSPTSLVGKASLDFGKIDIWKMSLGNTLDSKQAFVYEDCIKNNYILLGYGEGLDFTGCDNRESVKNKLKESNPKIKNNDFNITSVNIFKNKIKTGDIVIISDGNREFRAIGEVVGDYKFMSENEYGQMRPVKWLIIYDESLPSEKIMTKVFSQATIYQMHNEILKIDELNELLSGEKDSQEKNYVLIIDEINRGNVSKVLGELITLIEPDKRLGAQNEITVTLPYSGDKFGVPKNLYVIGTMNTSDRSIAFIDSALRRRFEFKEMLPDLDVIRKSIGNDGKINGVSILELLDTLNKRIELVYDRDHQIGHSYFIKAKSLNDLRKIFISEIIPLLQEYFYSDWNKVCQILGCPYDPETGEISKENKNPMITVSMLNAMDNLGFESDEVENSFRYEINQEFLSGDENTLKDFFSEALK